MTETTTPVEHVLVVPTLLFHEIGVFQGFNSKTERYLETLLDPMHTIYLARPDAEDDPSYKQLIPYCIFRCGDSIFQYTRGTKQGEARLHAKKSIGVGGHISTLDRDSDQETYLAGMERELEEEISIESGYQQQLAGLLNDDSNDVGKVHLGVVHVFDLDEPQVRPLEESMVDAGFAPLSQLVDDIDSFETWSQICLKFLTGDAK
jgi:predicted NUDIX family phosphoesterase